MGERLIRRQCHDFPEEIFRECGVPQPPVGMGEIEVGNRILGVERDRFLKCFHGNFGPPASFLDDSEVIPQDGNMPLGGGFRQDRRRQFLQFRLC